MWKIESSLLLCVFVFACDADDKGTSSGEEGAGEGSTTSGGEAPASAGEETSAGSESGEVGSGEESGTSTAETGEGESTGEPIDPCDDCDPLVDYCHVSIVDGPPEYSCRELPPECLEEPSCECLAEVVCFDGSNSCADPVPGEPVSVDCWEG